MTGASGGTVHASQHTTVPTWSLRLSEQIWHDSGTIFYSSGMQWQHQTLLATYNLLTLLRRK